MILLLNKSSMIIKRLSARWVAVEVLGVVDVLKVSTLAYLLAISFLTVETSPLRSRWQFSGYSTGKNVIPSGAKWNRGISIYIL